MIHEVKRKQNKTETCKCNLWSQVRNEQPAVGQAKRYFEPVIHRCLALYASSNCGFNYAWNLQLLFIGSKTDMYLPICAAGRSHSGQVMWGGVGTAFSGSAAMEVQNRFRAVVFVQAVGLHAVPITAPMANCSSWLLAVHDFSPSTRCSSG